MNYFDLLPDEVIEGHIFTYLKSVKIPNNSKDINCALKVVSLVCKRFNQILGDSKRLMSQFNIQFTEVSFERDDILRPVAVRKYSHCEIYDDAQLFSDEFCKMMKIYGNTMDEVTFYESISRQLAESVFRHLPVVQTLKFVNIYIQDGYNLDGLTYADLPLLRTLIIYNHPNKVWPQFILISSHF